MAMQKEIKTRFDLVSRSLGSLVGGTLTMGVGLVFYVLLHSQMGLSILLTGACLAAFGIAGMCGAMMAATKHHDCPKCGTRNQMLDSVKEFACMVCRTPFALRQAVHQLPNTSHGNRLSRSATPSTASSMARSGADRRAKGVGAAERTFLKAVKGQDHRKLAERRQ